MLEAMPIMIGIIYSLPLLLAQVYIKRFYVSTLRLTHISSYQIMSVQVNAGMFIVSDVIRQIIRNGQGREQK